MPAYEELDLTGLEIDGGKWAGDILRVSFGAGYKAKTRVGPVSGLHQWTLSSECLTDDEAYNDPVNGMPSFEYYLEFFKRYTTGDDDVFVIDFRGRKYHAGLVETTMPFEMLTYDLFSSSGVEIEQRRVPGFIYESDGSLPRPDAPTGLTLDFEDCTTLFASWDIPPDIEFPSVPVMTAATDIDATSITWNWNASTDNTAVTGYDLQVAEDSGFSVGLRTINLGNVLTYVDTGRAASQIYYAHVRAHDAVPNNSSYSSSVNATTLAGKLLDELGLTAKLAYGLRLLRDAYAGACLRVRRVSDDAEQDIGFVGEAMDWADAISFMGASSLRVVKWYDQSGSGKDLDPLATGFQPVLDTAAEVIDLDGSDDLLRTAAVDLTGTNAISYFLAGKVDATGTNALVTVDDQAGNSANLSEGGAKFVLQQNGSNNHLSIGASDTNFHLWSVVCDRSQAAANDSLLWLDGVAQTTTTDDTTNITGNFPNHFVGVGENSGAGRANAKFLEFILFDTAISGGNQATIQSNIPAFYAY